ncbi:type II toxin-antitoxin system VapC family toxin [Maricaulaceae bacterium MS644]
MIVIDASLGLEMFLHGPGAIEIKDRIEAAGRQMAASEVVDLEVLQTFLRLSYRGDIGPARTAQAPNVLRHALVGRIWALRDNLTRYDAACLALAEMLDAPLWTRDAKYGDVPGSKAVGALL